jgi:hypothetical protein
LGTIGGLMALFLKQKMAQGVYPCAIFHLDRGEIRVEAAF